MPEMPGALRRSLRFALLTAAGLVGTIALLELSIELVLRNPSVVRWIDTPQQINHLKNYYLGYDRAIVQFRSDCAVYDEVLTYRLRPGVSCTVVNREHTVDYAINRAGLRDTDDRLIDPAIIVTGDSQAMGWGVAAAETVSSRVEALTGRKTLNAAISSYETAREMSLLRELIQPSTQYVVVAYCDNDYYGNWGSVASGELPLMDRAAYERAAAEWTSKSRYFPFKHVSKLSQSVIRSFSRPALPAIRERPGFAAMNFLAIVDANRDVLRGRHLIVFDVNGFNRNDATFSTALREAASRSDLSAAVASMHVIDASSLLTNDDYYRLDDHMRPSGHDKIAREIASIVGGEKRWRVEAAPSSVVASPSEAVVGRADILHRKGALTVIYGWAAHPATGEPPATVSLVRDGIKLAEAEPVLPRDDVVKELKNPRARYTGFALAVRSDSIASRQKVELIATWPDRSTGTIADIADALLQLHKGGV